MNPALAAAVAASQPSPPPAKPLPVRDATEADDQIVAKGMALQLQETWRGHFVGDKLSKAGAHPAACCCCSCPLPLDRLKPQAGRGLVRRMCMLEHRHAAAEQAQHSCHRASNTACACCHMICRNVELLSCAIAHCFTWPGLGLGTAPPAVVDAYQQQ